MSWQQRSSRDKEEQVSGVRFQVKTDDRGQNSELGMRNAEVEESVAARIQIIPHSAFRISD